VHLLNDHFEGAVPFFPEQFQGSDGVLLLPASFWAFLKCYGFCTTAFLLTPNAWYITCFQYHMVLNRSHGIT